MQLVERLALRKSDAQRVLLSRKRKLAELYSVTTCPGIGGVSVGVTGFSTRVDAQTHDLYLSQLKAFQDANDLQKGCVFFEASLPPRRDISRPPPAIHADDLAPSGVAVARSSPKPAAQSIVKIPQPTSRPESPLTQPYSRSASTKPLDASQAPHGRAESLTTDPTPLPRPPAAALDKNASAKDDDPAQAPLRIATRSPEANTTIASHSLPPPLEQQEAQSSPASSIDATSSHTPAPEPASPTTSPGDEHAPGLEIMNTKRPQPASQEPQTPDLAAAPIHKMSMSSIDVDMIDIDPSTAFDSPVQPSKHPPHSFGSAKPIKPSISVDTQHDSKSYFDSRQGSGIVETPSAITVRSPSKPTPTSISAIDPARRATRIQSGVLQKKSVSEILGETPRSGSPNNDPGSANGLRALEKERKDKEKSRLSTVVFAKPQRPTTMEDDTIELQRTNQTSNELAKPEDRDYMYTLFESKAHSQNRQGSLTYLLQHSHKTISTTDHLADYQFQAHCRALKRLYHLQSNDKWSLRQRQRAEEPARPTSHWDFLLDHAKWMRTDFREERRWKIAAARALAESCAEWVASTASDKLLLQTRRRAPNAVTQSQLIEHQDTRVVDYPLSSPPALDPTGEDDSVSEDLADPRDVISSVPPAAIFSLGATEFTFTTVKTPAFDKLLNELPIYQPTKIEPDLSKSNLAEKQDARWKTDIIPISRYSTEKLKTKEHKPPLKRSRYDYNVDDSPPSKRQVLEPRETEVALFMPENKHIRDRIHPGHAFRPPAEHPMPTQLFFETRQSSQWVANDDDEVRRQAREYSFNWTLISELMTPRTLYVSGQDRRSAWECFERWIGLEGMPADMSKTPYFRTYSNRIETAQRNVEAQMQEIERRNGATPASARKKTTLPARVERKTNRRHLFMLDAMRKLAKKREAVRQKAQQSADAAALRKPNDVPGPRPGMKTPAEWSQFKHEKEQKMARQQEMYKQQLIAHQRAVVQQQRGQNPPPNGNVAAPAGPNQMRMPGPNGVPVPVPGVPNGYTQAPNGQPRPHPNMMGMPQGVNVPNGAIGPKAGMPPQMTGMGRSMASSPQQLKMQQEQLMRQAQHAQQNGSHSSPNVQHAALANGQAVNNSAAFMMSQTNGQGSPINAGMGASPRPQSSHMPQSLSSGPMPKINQLYANIKERNPNMSDEEIRNIATQQLLQWQQQATAAAAGNTNRTKVNQAALNAAIGAANSGAFAAAQSQTAMNMNQPVNSLSTMGQGMMSYEQAQQYHQRMRLQQAQQNANRTSMSAPMAPGMSPGMTNSPVMNMVRPISQHSQSSGNVNRGSATPVREQRSGSVSTNMTGNQGQPNGSQQGQGPGPGQATQSSPRVPVIQTQTQT